ncbi:phage head closure protein, partial [Liquorilactobacillus capillatus]|uniref:phage head closure protein n=1 Tax=Liquorilactobacillus capillatus TaxID=480931 RepID=UPI000A93F583
LNYDISRLKQRVEFGSIKSVEDDNTGDYKQEFVSLFKLWCGDYTLSTNQSINLLGIQRTTSKVIVIRHNDVLDEQYIARINDKEYQIVTIDSDSDINGFDVITLHKVSGFK